ncbi:MAG: 1-deoxy-D-xylulose-5-phosphate reductoisomerase [Eubacteriales bacterium]|nr:1-deoxy-D-xylulose-5-phosphate reductoisomerase [Eubacteriales bacterium]
MKAISIIGSTGSIGTQTLDIVRQSDDMKVVALAVCSNVSLLKKQISEFKPKIVAVWNEDKAKQLKNDLMDDSVCVVSGMEGLIAVATYDKADIVVTAIVGMIGIRPTVEAILAGKNIALANKETLVTAGHLIMPLAKEKGVSVLPVDSEHSAIFQCLQGECASEIERLIITASGGPFREKTYEELQYVTLEDALKHPNWSMGKKITIDSATLVNKGLEVIEARWLFGVAPEQIDVIVQPQSIIHSMVEFKDGSIKAQLGTPDMKLPIQYALNYPSRKSIQGERLDFTKLSGILLEQPNRKVFRGLDFAYDAMYVGGSMPTVYNAANECAVTKFMNKQIRFLQIYDVIDACMQAHNVISNPSLEDILETEQWVYSYIHKKFSA